MPLPGKKWKKLPNCQYKMIGTYPEIEMDNNMNWSKYLKTEIVDGRETAVYVDVKELIEIAKKEGVDFETEKSKFITDLGIPSYEEIVNKLGYPVEKGIVNLVWVLNSMGITTRQSCEGHPTRSNKNPNPNIELSEEMATKILVAMDGWEGVETGDVIFSRMLSGEGGDKNLVEIDFKQSTLVDSFTKYLIDLCSDGRKSGGLV